MKKNHVVNINLVFSYNRIEIRNFVQVSDQNFQELSFGEILLCVTTSMNKEKNSELIRMR